MKVQSYTAGNIGFGGATYSSGQVNAGGLAQQSGIGTSALVEGLMAAGNAAHQDDLRKKHETEKLAEVDAHLWSANRMSQFRLDTLTAYEQAKDSAQPGAPDFTKTVNDGYEKSLKGLAAEAPNKRSAQIIEAQAREFQNTVVNHSIQFEAGERQRFRVQGQLESSARDSQFLLMNPTNESWSSIVETRLGAIKSMNVDPSVRQKMAAGVAADLSENFVRGLGRQNPQMALEILNSGELNKLPNFSMSGDTMSKMQTFLTTLANREAGARNFQIQKGVSDMLADLVNPHKASIDAAGTLKATLAGVGYNYEKFDINKTPIFWPNGATDDEVKKALGPAGYTKAVESIHVALLTMQKQNSLKFSSPQEWDAGMEIFNKKYEGNLAFQVTSTLMDARNREMDLRSKDPGLVAERNMSAADPDWGGRTLGDKARLRLVAQTELGIAPIAQRVFTNAEVTDTAVRIGKATIDEAQQILKGLETDLVVKRPGQTPDAALYAKAMAQIYTQVPKEFMFANYVKDTVIGNYAFQAMKTKKKDLEEGLNPSVKKDISAQLVANTELQNFMRLMSLSSGVEGPAIRSSFADLVEKTALMYAGSTQNPSGSAVIVQLAKSFVTDQVQMKSTYYVPNTDHNTGAALNADKIDGQLDKAARNWAKADGSKFDPVTASLNRHLSQNYLKAELRDAANLAWITNSSGTGVYRAIRMKGDATQYEPLYDRNDNRYEILFSDANKLDSIVGQGKSTRNVSGFITGR